MNRAQRRARRQQPPSAVLQYAAAYHCPDCLSETGTPYLDPLGVWRLEVRHDDTCPTLQAMQREPQDEK